MSLLSIGFCVENRAELVFRVMFRELFLMAGAVWIGVSADAADPEGPSQERAWKVADFDAVLFTGLESYRSFDNGRRVFRSAGCAECHRFAGDGPIDSVATDLAKVTGNLPPREILEAVLEPGKKIAPEQAMSLLSLNDGRTVKGLVMKRSQSELELVPDLRKPGERITVRKASIRNEERLEGSPMPKGMVDRFREDDVLDLLAYLLSGGDPKHAVFRK